MQHVRLVLGWCLGCLVWLLAKTWRYTVIDEREPAALRQNQALVYTFWHGAQLPLLGLERPRRACVLVSWSLDGALQAGVLGLLGFEVLRGSSSRGGAAGFRALLKQLLRGRDAVFAVDGPRGPEHRVKPGALQAARSLGIGVCPVGAAAFPASRVAKSWDKFMVPWPFARVGVVIGRALQPEDSAWGPELLESKLEGVSRRAQQLLLTAFS